MTTITPRVKTVTARVVDWTEVVFAIDVQLDAINDDERDEGKLSRENRVLRTRLTRVRALITD